MRFLQNENDFLLENKLRTLYEVMIVGRYLIYAPQLFRANPLLEPVLTHFGINT